MFRKYLKEIGVNEEYWPETVYTSAKSEVRDFREKEYNKYHDKVGVNPAETWNLSTTTLMWLYERLVEYRKHASKTIDLEFHTFEIDGKEYTQNELLNDLIDMAECILCLPENIKKNSKVWKRLSSNKYIIECNKLNTSLIVTNSISFSVIDCEKYINDLEARFWKIWSIVFPAMWW